jgi:hypothetical protein
MTTPARLTIPADVPSHVIPLAWTNTWLHTMAEAEFRCQCAGECGAKHNPEPGATARRCPKTLRGPAAVRMAAVPTAPGSPLLIALCSRCLLGRDTAERRTERQAAEQRAADAPTLF